ncbi:DUF4055 domain-containing protein [Dyella sp. M7H15-1]|uniref:DUF4055 domain-containing protein n=1 Tax=Dyella sp. M7H15-1 TaxID=2501295 RepID=UPI0013E8C387|nr:DUF4055 domain-containing protein [Dyella sp. M7H15-1]
MIKALMGGTADIRAVGKTLLPKWPGEDGDSYAARLKTSVLYPAFRHTVCVNAARPFAKPPTVVAENIPEEWLKDIDQLGMPLPAMSNALLIHALAYGLCGVLVDYPPAEGVRTRADEKQASFRPYFVSYMPQQILGWKMQGTRLVQLRLLESIEVDDGPWATKCIEQVRVLTPGAWQTYRPNPNIKEQWDLFAEGSHSLKEIPWVFFYGNRLGFGRGECPLLDLAYLNVEHYQSSSDQQNVLHVARVPILVAIGFGESEIKIGASSAITSENEKASLTYTEHTGAAIEAGKQSLDDLEDRMRAIGAELIDQEQAPTATQINSEDEVARSLLQQIVEQFEESLEQALSFMAQWVGKPADGIEVELFKAYEQAPSTDVSTLTSAASAGAISKQTLFEELKRRDVLAPDREWADEATRLKAEAPDPSTDPNADPNSKPKAP